jgi:hypothetical protein
MITALGAAVWVAPGAGYGGRAKIASDQSSRGG